MSSSSSSSSDTPATHDPLSPLSRRFVLHWGEMGSRWGVNRTVAQIHALLFHAGRPMHAEEIAETLSVARSNVSTSLRERIQARRDARADAAPASGAISAPGDHSFTLHHQGQKRRYRVHVPASYRPGAAPSPLVMAFHGGGGNMNIQADDRYYGLISQGSGSTRSAALRWWS